MNDDQTTQDDNNENSSPIQFPCDFMVKAITKQTPEDEAAIITLIQKHFPDFDPETLTRRNSKDKTFCAYTIHLHIENKPQLDALYQDLSDAPEVLMAL